VNELLQVFYQLESRQATFKVTGREASRDRARSRVTDRAVPLAAAR